MQARRTGHRGVRIRRPGRTGSADPAAVARAIVLRQLTNSPKSRLQLARKLAERNVPEDVAEAVLDRFEEVGSSTTPSSPTCGSAAGPRPASSPRVPCGANSRTRASTRTPLPVPWSSSATTTRKPPPGELVERKLRGPTDLADRAERDKITRRLASMLARKGYQPSHAFRIVGEVLEPPPAVPRGDPERRRPSR